MSGITLCLWFDNQAEEAVEYYRSIFKDSKVGKVNRFSDEIAKVAGQPKGMVMTIGFELNGQPFVALNGGPQFKFNEAVSLVIDCKTQAEVDHYWEKLTAGGSEQPCGWLKDRYGVSWQVVPQSLIEMMHDPNPAKAAAAGQAMLQMKKIDIAAIKQAYDQAG
jgi:predicted 3-demethylubiquinone-9 3-methyltransferase (glyoxalase superfamily)